MSVSKRLRYEILRRDDHACRYCGNRAPDVKLTVDHVLPIALGGGDEASNLVTACVTCNAGKSSSSPDAPLVDAVSADALRWARAMQTAASWQSLDRAVRDDYRDKFWGTWNLYEAGGAPVPLPADWKNSLDRFAKLGLELIVIQNAIETAMAARANDRFAYFCGVVWTVYRERQEFARQEIELDSEAGR